MIGITKCEKKFDHRLGGPWPPVAPPGSATGSGAPPQKMYDWKEGSDDGQIKVWIRQRSGGTFVRLLYACRYNHAASQTEMGVHRFSILEIEAMIA